MTEDTFGAASVEVPAEVHKLHDVFSSAVPQGPIYHYTSQHGFLGILSSKRIWASKIHYLSDSAEFRYTLDLIEERINREIKAPSCEAAPKFCEALLNWLKGPMRFQNLFIASFSEDGDLLSQWRSYCPDGIGFSVGFTDGQLRPALKRESAKLIKCEYRRTEQLRLIDAFVSSALSSVDETEWERSPGAIAALSTFYIQNLAPAFKDPAFAQEREWRIVAGPNVSTTEVSFRPGKSMLIPYWEFPLCEKDARLEIEHIYVGPNPHGMLSGWSAIDATYRYNAHSNKGVEQSRIPYRSW